MPAQGPLHVFIHHNPLHAFEHLRFEEAVVQAGRLLGCEPYLAEERYREELRRGRIHERDLGEVLAAELGGRGAEAVIDRVSRLEFRRRLLVYGLPELSGPALRWTVEETEVLDRLRPDIPGEAREAIGLSLASEGGDEEEATYLRGLWAACCEAVGRLGEQCRRERALPVRHRDALWEVFQLDVDAWVHPVLIRFTAAFLDQGLADWALPGREQGLYRCLLELYDSPWTRWVAPMGAELLRRVRAERQHGWESWTSLHRALGRLGLAEAEWERFLCAEALALRGFAGMVRQFELRPDRVPAVAVPARLVDFLAVRLLLLQAALEHAARRVGFGGELAEFRPWLYSRMEPLPALSVQERAWRLFHVGQLLGLAVARVQVMQAAEIRQIEAELEEFDGLARRRLFHLAYERRLRHRLFDALAQHRPRPVPAPAFQAIFCLDEREESIRRHLEEVEPQAETFGAPGFFGVAMYYQGATDAHPRPLCPVAIRPRHFVAEQPEAQRSGMRSRLLRALARGGALVDKNVHLGSRRASLGAALFAAVGVLWIVPLVLRVVFPWLRRVLERTYGKLQAVSGRLALDAQPGVRPPVGERAGFTVDEMANIVFGLLAPLGIRDRFAPLLLVFGHGSTSLNNPHESAHDCGACGGGRGGPNARAFAQMANRPEVRRLLAARGLPIPAETWFVGGERNTASNDLTLYDTELVPEQLRALLARAVDALERARQHEAHERCRRFRSAPAWLPPLASLWHVQARATDLAQPRPEYGHATNALCVVGRRARTRGLFLDRRAFLVSYDPAGDPDGEQLARLLAAVVPVVVGISLEYYFGYVDPTGYGSGTKLPHNVTALLGVMDGAQSDLRTGLPWQMLEIHEPVRLVLAVEAAPGILRRIIAHDEALARLVRGRWLWLAALEPGAGRITELDLEVERAYTPEHPLLTCPGGSLRHFQGRRGHLPFVALERPAEAT